MAEIFAPDKRLLDAACFYAKLLGIADKEFTLNIERVDLTDEGICGACEYIGEDRDEFVIQLEAKKQHRDDKPIYQVLAHEMVHLKQYVTGELEGVNAGTVWQGRLMVGNEIPGSDFYWDSPWEIEAFGREAGLYSRWEHYRIGEYNIKGE